MPSVVETFQHALMLYRKSETRVRQLELAIKALSADPTPDLDYDMGPKFSLCVRHPANEVSVDISTPPEFLRPLFEAALVNEQAAFSRMECKLLAARETLQSG